MIRKALAFCFLVCMAGCAGLNPQTSTPSAKYAERSFQDSLDQNIQKTLLELSGLEREFLADSALAFSRAKKIQQSLWKYIAESEAERLGDHIISFLRSENDPHIYEIYLLLSLLELQDNRVGAMDWISNRDELQMLVAKASAARDARMPIWLKSEYREYVAMVVLLAAWKSGGKTAEDLPPIALGEQSNEAEEKLRVFFEHCSSRLK